MKKEQIKLRVRRIFWWVMLGVSSVVSLIAFLLYQEDLDEIAATVGGIALMVAIVSAWLCFSRAFFKCKVFEYEGREILVYVGAIHYYIKVDGEILDKKTQLIRVLPYSIVVLPIYLSCTVDDDLWITVDVGAFRSTKIKINDKLYK